MNSQISIIIVHWNTPELLKKQLKLLTKDKNLRVIVVDNAPDASIDWVESKFPSVTLIKNKLNRGFAFACNQGVTQTDAEWLLFLNPDVLVEPIQIDEMITYARGHFLDAASPIPQSEGYGKPVPSLLSLLVEFTPLKKIIPLTIFKNKTLTGGALLIKRQVFYDVCGFDERFFIWFEDSDLTKRLIDKKYRIGWIPISVTHQGGASFKKISDDRRNDLFFFAMNTYAQKNFSRLGQFFVAVMTKRFSRRKIMPILHEGVAVTVPNMRDDLLVEFFKTNEKFLSEMDELIIVSSALDQKNIWDWRKKYPLVRFIELDKNRGVASTINVGLRASTGKWIGTINDDVILTKDWIQFCLKCIKNPGTRSYSVPGTEFNIGVLNPIIYKLSGEIESAGVKVLPKGKAMPITQIPEDQCVEVDAVNGAVVLYNNEALNAVGIFDEKFGSYLEDIDLSLRMRRAGYKNIVVKNVSVIHVGQSTSTILGAKKRFYDARNWIYVILKNWGYKKILRHFPSIFIERLHNLSGLIKAF